jgi:hypothetical protein
MIVTFKSKASGNLIYFKDVAIKLLKFMGRDDKVPSALYAEDVSVALASLKQQLDKIDSEEQEKAAQSDVANDNAGSKRYISLTVRAQPLLEMLEKSQKKNCSVQWE